nr:two-component response regulator ARR12-like [Tanacetum cinerariifolium]
MPERASTFLYVVKQVESKSQPKSNNNQEKSNHGGEGEQEAGSGDPNGKFNQKRKDENEDFEDNRNEDDESSTQKKPRVVWSNDLHKKFVDVVYSLGIEKAVPKTIHDLMNVEGLTRQNVGSHLQKYRLYLKRISQQENTAVASGGSTDASSYMRTLDGFSEFCSLPGSERLPNAALSSYVPSGLLSRLDSATGGNWSWKLSAIGGGTLRKVELLDARFKEDGPANEEKVFDRLNIRDTLM